MNTILHLEVSSTLLQLVGEIARRLGFGYISCGRIQDALEIIKSGKIHYIFTALDFEDGNGFDLIKTLKAEGLDHIPITVFSANDSLEIRNKLFNQGIADFIPKKISPATLNHYIAKLVNKNIAFNQLKEMKIAVLDDSPTEILLIKNIFHHYELSHGEYFSLAADLLKSSTDFDIYLIDVLLKDSSGEVVIEELRRRKPQSVIIAISALSNQKSITNVLMVGADDYIIKPFSTGLFMARISANVRQTLFLKEISKKNQELALQAISDGLTGLYNHNHTYLRLEEEIAKAIRYQRPLSVIMLDIDRFKQINDSYGHPAGDQVLIQVSAIIKKSLRKSDIGGRYGGEEFLIILPETREKEANILANRIREKVKEIHMGDQSQCLSLSGGVYAWQGEDALKLVAEADRLLYRAKEMGRDRIEMKS